MKIDSSTKKNWFFRTWEREWQGKSLISATNFSYIANKLLTEILPVEIFKQSQITDLSGITENQASTQPLLTIKGSSGELPPLSYSLFTEFSSFQGSRIIHSVKNQRSMDLPDFLKPMMFAQIAPFTFSNFTLGIQHYRCRKKAFSFGAIPEATEVIRLDYTLKNEDLGELSVQITAEGLSSKDEFPFREGKQAEKLLELLRSYKHD